MTKEAYGIPVPRGVPKDWRSKLNQPDIAGALLREFNAPSEWGDPTACVLWSDRFARGRLVVAHYSNNRSATVRIDANGNWKTSFGDAGEAVARAKAEAFEEAARLIEEWGTNNVGMLEPVAREQAKRFREMASALSPKASGGDHGEPS